MADQRNIFAAEDEAAGADLHAGEGSRICHAGSIAPHMSGKAANAEPPQASVVIPALGHGKHAPWAMAARPCWRDWRFSSTPVKCYLMLDREIQTGGRQVPNVRPSQSLKAMMRLKNVESVLQPQRAPFLSTTVHSCR